MIIDGIWAYVPWLGVAGGLVSCMMAAGLVLWLLKQDPGSQKMRDIAKAIQEGANAYMAQQYRVVAAFAAVITIALWFWMGSLVATGFLIGSVLSALAGYIGMSVSVRANVRVAQAATKGISGALDIAFRGGAVTGLFVVGFGLLGLSLFLGLLLEFSTPSESSSQEIISSLVGLGFGASLISLFARIGGGIYTKAADVGADLVGKVIAGIPEDDPRNPAVIADNVGDNVGDCAGMGADLFETYCVTSVAAMLIGSIIAPAGHLSEGIMIVLPLLLGGVAVIASMVSVFFVRLGKKKNVSAALTKGLISATVITALGFLVLFSVLPEEGLAVDESAVPDSWISATAAADVSEAESSWRYSLAESSDPQNTVDVYLSPGSIFFSALIGLGTMVLLFLVTGYYTGTAYRPVKQIAHASEQGAATNIISGLAVGLEATIIPVIVIVTGILGSYYLSGLYGVAVAALSMLSMVGIVVAMDSFGPITDNGGGIAEMSGLPAETRKITDALDAVGNTTKAVTKGYAIGSAAFAALVLFYAFKSDIEPYVKTLGDSFSSGVVSFPLEDPFVLIGLLIGGMIPFAFGALSMMSVGRAAQAVIAEVKRQFRELPGIMEGTDRPQYDRCVAIVTRAALREMIIPALLPVITPILLMCLEFLKPGAGIQALGGALIGSIVTGFLLAIHMTSSGGAWDNAKKLIEDGHHGGKGSDSHKAAVIGDTVGDPYKDTAGPAFNPLIKILNIVALIIAMVLAH